MKTVKMLSPAQLYKQKRSAYSRFLPLTWTAEMTLSHLADTGDPDAWELFTRLGLDEEEIIDSPATILSPEHCLTRTVYLEIRRLVMDALAELTKASLFVDLPCGLSPRALRFARKGQSYLGIDLPPVIERIQSAIIPMINEDKRSFVRFTSADATKPDALMNAVGEADGELCVITEGLLMYLSERETKLFCEGVKSLLSRFGGCWITADPEMPLQMFLTLRAICGDRFPEVMEKGFQRKTVHNGRSLPMRPSDPSPLQIEVGGNISTQIEKANAFLLKHGLKADRMPMSILVQEPILPEKLSPQQAEALNETLDAVSCWVITVD